MNISKYRKQTRQTWADTWFPDVCLWWYRNYIRYTARTIDERMDKLKKALFYGDNGYMKSRADEGTFEDLDLSRGEKDLLHAVLGITTEAGELLEAIDPLLDPESDEQLDTINIDEEMGDVYYYLMRLHDTLETMPQSTMKRNLTKLLERYDEGSFSTEDALNRDKIQERQVLES